MDVQDKDKSEDEKLYPLFANAKEIGHGIDSRELSGT